MFPAPHCRIVACITGGRRAAAAAAAMRYGHVQVTNCRAVAPTSRALRIPLPTAAGKLPRFLGPHLRVLGLSKVWVGTWEAPRSTPPSICTMLSSKFERILPFRRDPCDAPHGKSRKRGVLHLRLYSALSTGSKEVKIQLQSTQIIRYQVNIFEIGDVP